MGYQKQDKIQFKKPNFFAMYFRASYGQQQITAIGKETLELSSYASYA